MGRETRRLGLDIIDETPWGTHFCQFYQTKEDLVDILVPYFKVGLENNEFCIWVTSDFFNEKEAKKVMRMAVPDFDRYLKSRQIGIIPHTQWYLKDGAFDPARVLNALVDKLNQVLAEGYDGIRAAGNTAWLERWDWKNFTYYEEEMNYVIGNYPMIAICTYCLDKYGAPEIIDVVSNHQSALIKRDSKWELIENSERERMDEVLRESEERFRSLSEATFEGIVIHDKGRILYTNQTFAAMFGYEPSEVIGMDLLELVAPKSRDVVVDNILSGYEKSYETVMLRKDGSAFPVEVCAKNIPYQDRMVRIEAVRDLAGHEEEEEEREALERRKSSKAKEMAVTKGKKGGKCKGREKGEAW